MSFSLARTPFHRSALTRSFRRFKSSSCSSACLRCIRSSFSSCRLLNAASSPGRIRSIIRRTFFASSYCFKRTRLSSALIKSSSPFEYFMCGLRICPVCTAHAGEHTGEMAVAMMMMWVRRCGCWGSVQYQNVECTNCKTARPCPALVFPTSHSPPGPLSFWAPFWQCVFKYGGLTEGGCTSRLRLYTWFSCVSLRSFVRHAHFSSVSASCSS
mmetsp:Transcript_35261/g.81729  ORF Transcript_35261/g.81729 Transcript_35261/m.81729 type:complete len:213 (-) Transcript_35261:467-1105(-)